MTRRRAVPTVGVVCFVLGLPSALWLGVFKNQDWVWSLGLLISGLFIAIAVIKYGKERFLNELINTKDEPRPIGRWFLYAMTVLIPLEFAALMTWWLYQAVTEYDPEGWWHPFRTFSVGTFVFQCGLLIIFLLLTNRFWVSKVKSAVAAHDTEGAPGREPVEIH